MERLTTIRQRLHDELKDYPQRQEEDVIRQWKFMGIFGGHRSYLGHDLLGTLMAVTFGGLGIWWLLERAQLSGLTKAWNDEQSERQTKAEAPQDIEGLVLAEPASLEEPPPWVAEAPSLAEQAITLMTTGPIKLSLGMFNVMKEGLGKIPVIGPIYALILGFQEKLIEKSYSYMEQVQVGLITGMAAYITALFGAIEVGLLMIGVSAVLAFTSFFEAKAETRLGRAALEWDYLLCSYYHQNRPDPFFVAYFKSAIMFYPRLFGFGSQGEQTLFNRLTGQASLLCFLLIPVDLLIAMFGSEPFTLVGFATGTLLGIVVSISALAMYAPAICGSLTRHKLMGETSQLKVAGGIGMVAAAVGTVLGYLGVGMAV
ncbi:MAG: hypothetical protein CMH50_00670 [Myxococcales bacterium]|nr:hypothetical protein [Myxococcales bacterium]